MFLVRTSAGGGSSCFGAARRCAVVLVSMMLALGSPAPVEAGISEITATVRHVAGEAAPDIGLIGDSTLSGVRWFDEYGDLKRFNFVFDAESCRRTIERSCWSREQYRPRNALAALEDEAGDWGQVLVVMSGYNDSANSFDDGVEEMVAEAQRQGIGSVVWLSLRTKGVDYEEPLHLANGSTYRGANRSLYELAGELGGYLQIADWATYSAASPDWFENDGAHLTRAGAVALTTFIAGQVDTVLAGGTITPATPPWEEVRDGDEGEIVADVQQALLASGADPTLIADGEFGPQTLAAVTAFQRTNGLVETGVVDATTAEALDLYQLPVTAAADIAPTITPTSVPTTVAAVDSDDGGSNLLAETWWLLLLLAAVALWFMRRPTNDDTAVSEVDDEFESQDALVMALPYDHSREHDH